MSHPLITVVTVCRNVAAELLKTARSVAEQDFDDFEYIVVDGASTDDTPELLASGATKATHWVSEPDGGIYDAMNKGAQLAQGEWVIFMNAGDTFASHCVLSRIAPRLMQTEATVVYGDVVKTDRAGMPVVKVAEEPRNHHRMFFCHQSAFTLREAIVNHPFDTRHKLSADFKFFKTLLREGHEFEHVGFPVAVFDTAGVSNRRRSAGLADNMSIVMETDGLRHGFPFLVHLALPYLMARLRGK